MNLKKKLIGLVVASLMALGAAGPLAAIADGNPAETIKLTPSQVGVMQSMIPVIASISSQVQTMALQRNQEGLLFAQMSSQLGAISAELQQGNITPSMFANMSTIVGSMSTQVSSIAARRAKENQVLAALTPLLDQLMAWLRSMDV